MAELTVTKHHDMGGAGHRLTIEGDSEIADSEELRAEAVKVAKAECKDHWQRGMRTDVLLARPEEGKARFTIYTRAPSAKRVASSS